MADIKGVKIKMSIIYEALQKVERSKEDAVLQKPKTIEPVVAVSSLKSKNTKFLFFSLFAILLVAAIVIVPRYSLRPIGRVSFKNSVATEKYKTSNKGFAQDKQTSITEPKIQAETQSVAPAYLLQGIVYDNQLPSAVINGKTLRVSETIDAFQVKEITPTTVKLVNPKDNSELTLSF